jgi:hypothetical protein
MCCAQGTLERNVALCSAELRQRLAPAGSFSLSMEAEMERRAKRRWRAAVQQQHGPANVSPHRSLLGVPESRDWLR